MIKLTGVVGSTQFARSYLYRVVACLILFVLHKLYCASKPMVKPARVEWPLSHIQEK